jgi:2,4-dienoyl-CoA reductase-like NADH-dependent reductase (Old Yellow Enzyme family)
MNDRILELANKANEDVGFTFKMEDARKIHELMEKFAELIVEECLDLVSYGGEFCSRPKLVEKIKQHFGVEE